MVSNTIVLYSITTGIILMSINRKDRKEEDTATPSPSQIQKEQQQAVNKALDETKDEIKTATKEAAREIPHYIHKDLATYKNKPFKPQEKLQITTLNLKKK
jgi:uncharacterized FlaG/YvyC family protein